MKRTGERRLDTDLPKYYDTILYSLNKAAALSKINGSEDTAGMHSKSLDERSEHLYKHHLSRLYRLVRPKLSYNDDVEIDAELQRKIESSGVRGLKNDECDELLTTLQNLLEKIGVTRFETGR